MPKKLPIAALSLGAALALSVLPAAAAFSAPSTILNGDFEADEPGSTTITGWTAMNQLIDLGVTPIAGCMTVDTSDYTNLRGWDDEVEYTYNINEDANGYLVDESGSAFLVLGEPLTFDGDYFSIETLDGPLVEYEWSSEQWEDFDTNVRPLLPMTSPDPSERADNVVGIPEFFDEEELEFETTVDGDPGAQAAALYSYLDTWNGYDGYVAHGPAIFSDPFTVTNPRSVNVDWSASGDGDDFHVFGYLLNTATCEQIEVLDATGESQDPIRTSLNIPSQGTYRFVFVSGSFDQSFGGVAGANLRIDSVSIDPILTGPDVELTLDAQIGDHLGGTPVSIVGANLKPSSEYTLTLRSTPIVLHTGTTDPAGAFSASPLLPASIEPGAHTLTLVGTAPDGSEVRDIAYITVGQNGELLYLSFTAPEKRLPDAGADAATPLVASAALLLLGAIGLGITARRHRAAS